MYSRHLLPLRPTRISRLALNHVRRSSTLSTRFKPIRSVLIANRGEIALRVARTAATEGIRATTVYTDPDTFAEHAHATPYSLNLGLPNAYLDIEKIIIAAKTEGCDSIHPGYGFLSENARFAQRCAEEGITFVGPPAQAITSMGSKSEAKEIMLRAGVSCVPGYHGQDQSPQLLLDEAEKIGFPVLIKAVKGGGGKGMRIASSVAEFPEMLASAQSESRQSFGDDAVLIEKYILEPRHVEVQVFRDSHGNSIALGDRDCSVQRRHQKIIEESPAPGLSPELRKDMWSKARAAADAVDYLGAGTVEFIYDTRANSAYFLEFNTRLQVEHPVTEMVTGTDLVRWQFLVAAGNPLPLTQEEIEANIARNGHAFEARIYAENPDAGFIPDSGMLTHLRTPKGVRIDSGFRQGDEVSSFYDPMIAKLIVGGPDRGTALGRLVNALEEYEIAPVRTNVEFLKRLAKSQGFVDAEVETGFIEKHREELFKKAEVKEEVYAQAALAILVAEMNKGHGDPFTAGEKGLEFQDRVITLAPEGSDEASIPISLSYHGSSTFTVSLPTASFSNIRVSHNPATSRLTSYFPHKRLESSILLPTPASPTLVLFQNGQEYRFITPQPSWVDAVLGAGKDVEHSVKAPMPCKVLRVEVKEGQSVERDQVLMVIESMKMETVVRSPVEGVVRRVVHGEGEVVKAGVSLVLFEE